MLTNNENFPLRKILALGFLVGTFDILSAFIDTALMYGSAPDKVLKYIAGAAFGKNTYPDTMLVITGLLFHYIIAVSFTFLFYFVYPILKNIFRYKLLIAIVYGMFMQAFMRFVVLPQTRLQLPPFNALKQLKAAAILIVAIGLPLSLLMPRLMKPREGLKAKEFPTPVGQLS